MVWIYPTEAPVRSGVIRRSGNEKRGRVLKLAKTIYGEVISRTRCVGKDVRRLLICFKYLK
jgi:hypothetical protein